MIARLILATLVAATCTACAARGGVPRPFPGAPLPPGATTPAAPPAPLPAAPAVSAASPTLPLIGTALSYRGVPYRNGGSDPTGFDCSGFVQWVFAQSGRALPREVRDQFELGRSIDRDDVQPGDLVFFQTVSRGPSHVGIALGGNEFIHAPSSRGVVRIENYTVDYWRTRFIGARRLE